MGQVHSKFVTNLLGVDAANLHGIHVGQWGVGWWVFVQTGIADDSGDRTGWCVRRRTIAGAFKTTVDQEGFPGSGFERGEELVGGFGVDWSHPQHRLVVQVVPGQRHPSPFLICWDGALGKNGTVGNGVRVE